MCVCQSSSNFSLPTKHLKILIGNPVKILLSAYSFMFYPGNINKMKRLAAPGAETLPRCPSGGRSF